jgi:hypothetical protein
MGKMDYFNDVDDSDFDDIERLGAVPELEKRPADNRPIQPDALPITEEHCRRLYAASDLSYAAAQKPIERDRLRAYLEYQIIPAIKKHLKFMGVEALPKIQIVTPDAPMPGAYPIRYPASSAALADMSPEDTDLALDIALTNAAEGEIPCTFGHVPIPAFSAIFCHVAAMIDKSTTAHRRYKNRFTGERIRLVFHLEYNLAEMFVPYDFADALDESVKAYLRGK